MASSATGLARPRVVVVAGTRPEIIKLVPVFRACDAHPALDPVFCHSGQHPDLGRDVLDAADIVLDEWLSRPAAPDLATLLAGLITTLGAAMDRQRPDAVVVQGDTATTLAGALAAFHRGIPVAHVEAGLRSGDMARPFPEEGYRRLVTPLARWNFAPTPVAAEALRREGVAEARIDTVGNTVIDALHWALARLAADAALGADANALIAAAEGRPLVLATIHRRETGDAAMRTIAAALRDLASSERLAIVLPLHPRAESETLRAMLVDRPGISLVPALDYFAFLRLLQAARLVVSDSGGVVEEATALGRPVLVLREAIERPEAVAAGSARIIGHDGDALLSAARYALARAMPEPSMAFGDGRAAQRIAERLAEDLGDDRADDRASAPGSSPASA